MDALSTSVIIPTYNRRSRLAQAVAALGRQSVPRSSFEIVVIDDGSTDGTRTLLQGLERDGRVRALFQDNAGPSAARNRGLAAARGALLVFLDDDVEPTEHLLREHRRVHDTAHRDVAVIGPLSSFPYYPEPWVLWQQAKLEKQYREMVRGDFTPDYRNFWTGNASVKRAHVVRAGGFDVAFKRGEDVELGYRLSLLGLEFRFNPEARGFHHATRSFESFLDTHRSYGAMDVRIFEKLGAEGLIDVLSKNFGCLHPGTRWLVRRSTSNRARASYTAAALSAFLRSTVVELSPAASAAACGALANLCYWEAASLALGPALASQIFRRGEARAQRTFW